MDLRLLKFSEARELDVADTADSPSFLIEDLNLLNKEFSFRLPFPVGGLEATLLLDEELPVKMKSRYLIRKLLGKIIIPIATIITC